MTNHVEAAETFELNMLVLRRHLISTTVTDTELSSEHLQYLALVNDSIAIAKSIVEDETSRSKLAEYQKHDAAGTLVDDGMGNLCPPLEVVVETSVN